MFGEEAVCPDGLFVPVIFQESDFYLNSLIFGRVEDWIFFGLVTQDSHQLGLDPLEMV
jgi:hypothetical protein